MVSGSVGMHFPWVSSSCFFLLSMCLPSHRPFNLNVNMPAYEYTIPAVLQPCCFLLSLLKCVKIWYASGNIFHSSLRHLHMTTGWQTDDWQSYRPPDVDWRQKKRSEAGPQIVEVEESSLCVFQWPVPVSLKFLRSYLAAHVFYWIFVLAATTKAGKGE